MSPAEEIEMMRAGAVGGGDWPLVLVLPLAHAKLEQERTGMPLLGFLVIFRGPVVHAGNVADLRSWPPRTVGPAFTQAEANAIVGSLYREIDGADFERYSYDTFEAVYEAGWRIN